jgi:membrane-bound ClpP family serine protease
MPKILTPDITVGAVHHEWGVQEYEQHERSSWWYIAMITIGIILVVYAMLTLNFLFALSIVLIAIILFLQSHDEAMVIPFAITELGIVVGTKFYSYKELNQFYIIYQPPRKSRARD